MYFPFLTFYSICVPKNRQPKIRYRINNNQFQSEVFFFKLEVGMLEDIVLDVLVVLFLLAFVAWILSLIYRRCMKSKTDYPKVTNQGENVDFPAKFARVKSERNCIEISEQPSLFTPSINYGGHLSIHSAWAHGRASLD